MYCYPSIRCWFHLSHASRSRFTNVMLSCFMFVFCWWLRQILDHNRYHMLQHASGVTCFPARALKWTLCSRLLICEHGGLFFVGGYQVTIQIYPCTCVICFASCDHIWIYNATIVFMHAQCVSFGTCMFSMYLAWNFPFRVPLEASEQWPADGVTPMPKSLTWSPMPE